MTARQRRNLSDRLRPVRKAIRGVEVWEAMRFGRSLLSLLFRTRVLVLETTGRRTGRRRRSIVAVLQLDDGELVIAGGAGGQTRPADWVANLRAAPSVRGWLDRRELTLEAREVTGDERADLWPVLVRTWPRIEVYERRAGRFVPIFRLVPRPVSSTG